MIKTFFTQMTLETVYNRGIQFFEKKYVLFWLRIFFMRDMFLNYCNTVWNRKYRSIERYTKSPHKEIIHLLPSSSDMVVIFIDRRTHKRVMKPEREMIYEKKRGVIIAGWLAEDFYALHHALDGKVHKMTRSEATALTTTPLVSIDDREAVPYCENFDNTIKTITLVRERRKKQTHKDYFNAIKA